MGCISSKSILQSSLSIRRHWDHPTTTPAPALTWEDLLTSHTATNDKLFSIVCSTAKFTTTAAIPQPQSPTFNRSASFQATTNTDSHDDDDGIDISKKDLKDKNLAGSRSFHTVEDYEALLNRILNPQSNSLELEPQPQVVEVVETGWKRKAVAKCLKSLDVESPAFPPRFRQQPRYHCHIYSPGTYVTPKFGSYNEKAVPVPTDAEAVFSPELVAAFEDRMLQLKEEEDDILKRMDDDEYDVADVMDKNQ